MGSCQERRRSLHTRRNSPPDRQLVDKVPYSDTQFNVCPDSIAQGVRQCRSVSAVDCAHKLGGFLSAATVRVGAAATQARARKSPMLLAFIISNRSRSTSCR